MYTKQNYFDSYGCPPQTNVVNHIKKGIYSDYQIQKNDNYGAAYCLYVFYLTQIIGFKNTVSNLYFQTSKRNRWKNLKDIQLNLKLFQKYPIKLKIETMRKIREKLSKDRQEFINNMSASGFKQFHLK